MSTPIRVKIQTFPTLYNALQGPGMHRPGGAPPLRFTMSDLHAAAAAALAAFTPACTGAVDQPHVPAGLHTGFVFGGNEGHDRAVSSAGSTCIPGEACVAVAECTASAVAAAAGTAAVPVCSDGPPLAGAFSAAHIFAAPSTDTPHLRCPPAGELLPVRPVLLC